MFLSTRSRVCVGGSEKICLPPSHQGVRSCLLKETLLHRHTHGTVFSLWFGKTTMSSLSISVSLFICPSTYPPTLICSPPSFLRLISKCHQRELSAAEISLHNVTVLHTGGFYIDPSVWLQSSFARYIYMSSLAMGGTQASFFSGNIWKDLLDNKRTKRKAKLIDLENSSANWY